MSAPHQTAVLRVQNMSVTSPINPHGTIILTTASPWTRESIPAEELHAPSPRPCCKARNHPIGHRAVDDFE
ncbi:hypothetical protein B0G81_1576 [Paraburkholderia sp. BL6665CI2N2]|nr:hypothetical protein B0G81_1576 [Paraburkholderia sp. BL6665CI2N2]